MIIMNFEMKKYIASSLTKGFTLVELIVVIAIIGVLAAVLIAVVDPVDKINSANDAGVISSVSQFGKANDAYAATHNNGYVGPAAAAGALTLGGALTALNSSGESKISSYTPPTGYTVTYLFAPSATCTIGANDCTGYAFIASGLKSKKNTAAPVFQVVNGKSCFVTAGTTVTQAQLNTSPTNPVNACP